MNYDLEFHPKALEEWKRLDNNIKKRFKKKLVERLYEPKISEAKIKGLEDIYEIDVGGEYQLIYKVNEDKKSLLVLKITKQDNIKIYKSMEEKKESS